MITSKHLDSPQPIKSRPRRSTLLNFSPPSNEFRNHLFRNTTGMVPRYYQTITVPEGIPSSDGRWSCLHCVKTFNSVEGATQHMRSNSCQHLYYWCKCGGKHKFFKTEGHILCHAFDGCPLTFSGVNVFTQSIISKAVCGYCGQQTKSRTYNGVQDHIQAVHSRISWSCTTDEGVTVYFRYQQDYLAYKHLTSACKKNAFKDVELFGHFLDD
ncbi:hypothetical protein SAICODRAFT_220883 [Saitoella complicata NRRL Y-17804]|uniref:uncharacterized protein n=1 Tax=Saitoella complicata (strain BCRC 22490 / CBS 7301 / JCM 7358 / NBRC 10748 / NRRL Y-17804) TaxID=698492 RepID=UPI000867AEB6|nr:uncharacterized protein SAICODRAFT_220883 [Saitoella complicata NRRL Y-17804]ODQ54010.1 hypothetical protein SAICODRAFT_220883 [Saitoella complicata NRRL Y-17804]